MLRLAGKQSRQMITKMRSQFASMIEIYIDDVPYKVDPQATIFQAAYSVGVIIPRFCYHERLSVAGNCRMCLVEVEKAPKPIASCAAQVAPGMRIRTQSEKTRIARGGVMEFLLAHHPLDCPICDQGGECDLQDISETYGYKAGRYNEYKRAVEDKNIGPIVRTSMNRCIHCTRCIRFNTEIAGGHELGHSGRGLLSEIGTYLDKMVTSELSGNLVDLCPVGALTSEPYAFTSRPWELKSFDTIDLFETILPYIQADTRGPEIMRILPRIHEEVNEEWIADKSRHAFDGLKKQRLTIPMQRKKDGTFVDMNWQEALKLAAKKINAVNPDQLVGVIGEFSDVEAVVALKDFMNRCNSDNFQLLDNPQVNVDFRTNYIMNSRIQGIEDADVLLLVGTNPKYESPVLNARILKATKRGLKVFMVGPANDLTYPYTHLGNNASILEEIANGTHPFSQRLQSAKLPMILTNSFVFQRSDGQGVEQQLAKIALDCGVIQDGWNGYNVMGLNVGQLNAAEVGIQNKQCNDPKVVILMGADNGLKAEDFPKDAFVIYIGSHGDEGAYYADLILPSAAYLEKNGTYVSSEGRVQSLRLVTQPPGAAQAEWKILRALSEECGQTLPYDSIEELRFRVAELAPHLLKYDYIEPTLFGKLAMEGKQSNGQQTINNTPFQDAIDNYYMTDAVSRQSVTMAKCSTALNPHKFATFRK